MREETIGSWPYDHGFNCLSQNSVFFKGYLEKLCLLNFELKFKFKTWSVAKNNLKKKKKSNQQWFKFFCRSKRSLQKT